MHVSSSRCIRILPMRTDLQQSRKPCHPISVYSYEELGSSHLFHRLSSSHDRNTAYLTLELNTRIRSPNRRSYFTGYDWQVVEAFFNKQTDDTIRIENEISSICGFVTYHAVWDSACMSALPHIYTYHEYEWVTYVSRAIN